MDFNFPPETFSDLLIVWGIMFVVMLVFWASGQILHAKGYGPQMERLADRMDAFKDRIFLPAGRWSISQGERLAGLRRREKREKQ
ncbi:hypothetical protein NR756_06650 [Alloalcanivorax xenomutans]|uniref:hypothetical protein n=1 Tax=Alloalcanivorax xenomutans TaxID=1094342 RepID=UPI003A810C70